MATMIEKTIIEIGGKPYKDFNFLNFVLTKEFLKPNELRFTMQRKHVSTDKEDVTFSVPKELIGEKISLQITTSRFDEKADLANETLEFEGIVFEVDVKRNSMTSEVLIDVLAYSPDYILMDNKHCKSFLEHTLHDIISITTSDFDPPVLLPKDFNDKIPYSVQYNETRYEYLVRLAKRYGQYFYFEENCLNFGLIETKTKKLHPRTDILNYKYSAKIKHDNIEVNHINYMDTMASLLGKNFKGPDDYVDDSETKDAMVEFAKEIKDKTKKVFISTTEQNLEWSRPEKNDTDELKIAVKNLFLGAKANQTICSGSTVRADLLLGGSIIIKDMYENNNDSNYYEHDELLITKLVHTADVNGNYKNEFEAISAKCKYPPYTDPDIFRYSGSQQAGVIRNDDPEKLGRVMVMQMWQKEKRDDGLMKTQPWIRVAQPHGGGKKGFYYTPEVGEVVMVGYENGNVEKPYVMGSLYNDMHSPDEKWVDDKNSVKGIRTRNGHTIEIHDEGEDGYIRIYDNEKENYVLTFSTDDQLIRLQSKGNIELDAGWDIILNAGNNIIQKANNNRISEIANTDEVKANGHNYYSDSVIHMEAKNKFFASGKSSAILDSDSKTQIQAPTVNAVGLELVQVSSHGKAALRGQSEVEVISDGIVNIKGSMVNIN